MRLGSGKPGPRRKASTYAPSASACVASPPVSVTDTEPAIPLGTDTTEGDT